MASAAFAASGGGGIPSGSLGSPRSWGVVPVALGSGPWPSRARPNTGHDEPGDIPLRHCLYGVLASESGSCG